ncbi:MAG: hypothetical protein BWY25_02898 [Chloroflexi bacterium ADurb.Bin222]|nr:MAG: hypothetical protein BWY25_02898 [Chloroflexi bacterium ADurb.Bin222]
MRVPQFDQPKVHQHRPPVGADDDVLRLDVPVDDPLAVAIGQRVQQLSSPAQHLRLRQRTLPLDPVGQALPLHEVHHQVGVAVLLEKVANPYQVRMVQAGQDLRLLLELLAQLGQDMGGQPRLGGHLFERHGHVESRIPGAVDGAHSALAQQRDNAVAILEHFTNL